MINVNLKIGSLKFQAKRPGLTNLTVGVLAMLSLIAMSGCGSKQDATAQLAPEQLGKAKLGMATTMMKGLSKMTADQRRKFLVSNPKVASFLSQQSDPQIKAQADALGVNSSR